MEGYGMSHVITKRANASSASRTLGRMLMPKLRPKLRVGVYGPI